MKAGIPFYASASPEAHMSLSRRVFSAHETCELAHIWDWVYCVNVYVIPPSTGEVEELSRASTNSSWLTWLEKNHRKINCTKIVDALERGE
jgi:hypothetical protein